MTVLLFTSASFAQVIDLFDYTGAASSNGWTTHSGTAGQLNTLTTPSDAGNSLSFAGLPASTGNRLTLVAGNSEDINKAITGVTGTVYVSFLLKATSTTEISATGEYFTGIGGTSGASVTILGARTFVKQGATPGTFVLGIQNTTGGSPTPTPTYTTTEYAAGTTLFVVIKLNNTVSPIQADLYVNPVPGGAEPAATVSNAAGTGAFANLASVFIRQAGSGSAGTGNLEIDEIRAGATWAEVTPNGCASSSTLNVTNCGPYTLNSQTYSVSGSYTQVLPNANVNGCDSTINLNLTVNNPSSSTLNETACGSYTLNGQTYTSSGTYTQTLTNGNAAGCDSTITLNLSIVASITYYEDADNDGFGNPAVSQDACSAPAGFVINADDCDDTDDQVGMGMTYYADTDNDGLGDPSDAQVACTQPVGYVTNSDDCDDTNDQIGAAQSWYPDTDNDGYGDANAAPVVACMAPANHVSDNTDCDDNNNTVHPGATEIPNNGIDEDCSGSDLNTLGAQIGLYEFTGNECTTPNFVLGVTTQPANATFSDYGTAGTDCATGTNYINGSNWNMASTVDLGQYNEFMITPDNCFEMNLTRITLLHRVSNSAGTPTVHLRSSLDGYGADIWTKQITTTGVNINDTILLPSVPFGSVTGPVTFRFYITEIAASGATYRQDNVGVNGFITAMTPQTFYADADNDGYGDPAVMVTECVPPAGYVSDNTDCNDSNADENPDAVWYEDADNDGYGDASVTLTQCTQPAGYVANSDDCDDTDNAITLGETYYADADNDGFGDAMVTMIACTQPAGYVDNADDCDDTNNGINPNATDVLGNGIDENCDGTDGNLGIQEAGTSTMNVYPNPGTAEVTISLNGLWNSETTVVVLTAEGKLAKTTALEMNQDMAVISTMELEPGVYFIQVTDSTHNAIVRWVKQ